MKRIGLVVLLFLSMIGLFAATRVQLLALSEVPSARASERMDVANQLYEEGKYVEAVQAYEQLASQGVIDSALFYNLGNAHFRRGDYGRAILNYRRAQELAPRDADIAANLALARAQAADQVEEAGDEGLLGQIGSSVLGWVTLDELAMATLFAWILFVFVLILFASARRGSGWRRGLRYVVAMATIVLAFGVLCLGSSLYVHSSHSEAIVIAAEVDVTSGPGTQYVAEFTLHSGAELDLLEVRENWVRVALPGEELEGWVPATAVEALGGSLPVSSG
jgi:hypothetical protein